MLADRKQAFETWWSVYPPERRVKKSACRSAFDMALWHIGKERECDEAEAIRYLQERTATFARSPTARGQFCVSSERWLAEHRWEDSDESWGYKRKAYHSPLASTRKLAESKRPPKNESEIRREQLEAQFGSAIDALTREEIIAMLSSEFMRSHYIKGGMNEPVRIALLNEMAKQTN